jgi:hypothetical protein
MSEEEISKMKELSKAVKSKVLDVIDHTLDKKKDKEDIKIKKENKEKENKFETSEKSLDNMSVEAFINDVNN